MDDDRWFGQLAEVTGAEVQPLPAPARLKARIYSALIEQHAASGPLLSLTETKAGGRRLCIFEEVLAHLPVDERVKAKNPCRICHARVLGERLDRAPIFWPGCPYSKFHRG
jgi:hypothetical protein